MPRVRCRGRSRSATGARLQDTALRAWGGNPAGFASGQKALFVRAKLNGLAAAGAYKRSMESRGVKGCAPQAPRADGAEP